MPTNRPESPNIEPSRFSLVNRDSKADSTTAAKAITGAFLKEKSLARKAIVIAKIPAINESAKN